MSERLGCLGKIFDGVFIVCYKKDRGGMSEWLKEAVLKTVVPKGTVGSNPTPSANKIAMRFYNEAPRSKLRGIKAEFAEANPPSL